MEIEDENLENTTLNLDENMIEEINNTVNSFIDRLSNRLNVPEYLMFSYIKDNHPLTIIYTETNQLVISSIVLVDYYNKYDIHDIVTCNNPEIFTEECAIDISKYMKDNIIPDYVNEYIDELNGISNTPMCSKDLKQLKKKSYNKENYKDEKCQICLELFEDNQDILEFKPCNHIFCYDCAKMYLEKYNNICPLCRTEMGEKEKKDTSGVDIGQLVYNFINKYCDRCTECFFHRQREEIINLFMLNNGDLDLKECIDIVTRL